MAIGAEPAREQLPAPAVADGDFLRLGVEEEFHVVDLASRELVAQAPTILEGLPATTYSDELQRSVVESNSPVCTELTALRESLVASRRLLVETAAGHDLGVVGAGTVPLVDPLRLAVTPSVRYERMLADYQLLVREQLICGAQVHVQVSDRDLAVAIAQRVTPHLPVLLALSASSPFWMGEDTGYASTRSLLWQRWPTAGLSGEISTAAEHDALVADLVASGTISDPGMIYFDVRPSAHVPTLELRVPDACPDVDDVVLLAGLFRALVRRERNAVVAGTPAVRRPAPLLRSALWRAARSGLEDSLLDLPRSPRPVRRRRGRARPARGPARPAGGGRRLGVVTALAERAIARGSSAAQQRAAYQRRGRLTDVVDRLLNDTDPRRGRCRCPGRRCPAPAVCRCTRAPATRSCRHRGPTPITSGSSPSWSASAPPPCGTASAGATRSNASAASRSVSAAAPASGCSRSTSSRASSRARTGAVSGGAWFSAPGP